ncbi:MAG: TrkH family potassium uptake protein [Lentisphaeria bacterium]|nr:TrkH family potassium uptake protein [Lentisphaeria bacterium]
MNIRTVFQVVAAVLLSVGIAMLSCVFVGWLMNDSRETLFRLFYSSLITILFSLLGLSIRSESPHIGYREGFGIVTFSWVFASIFGSIPYIWIAELTFVDAFFETMSGFTTTGSSILGGEFTPGIEELGEKSYGLLFWRSMTNWLGGMGIVVLSLAILPLLGIGGMQLYKAEAPGPTTDQLSPRVAGSAKRLWFVYFLLTIILFGLLLLSSKMNIYDALNHAMATMATGGFSTKDASIASFDSAYVEWVIILFMFLAGANFALHVKALSGHPNSYIKDEEFKTYCILVTIAITFISINLISFNFFDKSIGDSIRHATFAVLTCMTTTGFATANFDVWPNFSQVILVMFMLIGGSGGSTSGGMKVSRWIILFKNAFQQVLHCIYPRSVMNVRLNNHVVPSSVVQPVLNFFFVYILILFTFTFLVAFLEPGLMENGPHQIETAFTSTVATMCNIGPGLGSVGPTQNFAWMAPKTKLLLSLAMLIGRLEVYTVIVLILPSFWRK